MPKRKHNEKVYAFIDSQNLNLGIIDQGWQLDFSRFRKYLKDKYLVEQAFLFIGKVPGNKKLYTYLSRSGYKLIFKPIVLGKSKHGDPVVKGNVDSELVMHATLMLTEYDKAVVITGDGDFHCLVDMLKKAGKLKRLVVPNRKKYSRLLWEFKKDIDFMNQLDKKLGKRIRK